MSGVYTKCEGSKEVHMLRWAAIFLVISIVAGILGLGGLAGTAATIAKTLFFIFIALFAISLVFGVMAGHRLTHHH